MTPVEIGTDVAGSIRYPAHCCGVFGLRTTDGLLPIDDLGPEDLPKALERLVTVGPMARNIQDLQLVLSALKVEEDDSPPPSRLRIAWSDRAASVPADESTRRVLSAWLDRLKVNHEVCEARPDVDDELAYRIWGHLVGYEYRRALPLGALGCAFTSLYTLRYRLGDGPLTQYVREGLRLSEEGYREALSARESKQRRVDAFFAERADVWILPVSPGVAIERMSRGRDIQTANGPVSYSRYLGAFLCPTAVYGTPAVTIPIGVGEGGLPIAVQAHGARFSDVRLLRTAAAHLVLPPR
jgi:amidase